MRLGVDENPRMVKKLLFADTSVVICDMLFGSGQISVPEQYVANSHCLHCCPVTLAGLWLVRLGTTILFVLSVSRGKSDIFQKKLNKLDGLDLITMFIFRSTCLADD